MAEKVVEGKKDAAKQAVDAARSAAGRQHFYAFSDRLSAALENVPDKARDRFIADMGRLNKATELLNQLGEGQNDEEKEMVAQLKKARTDLFARMGEISKDGCAVLKAELEKTGKQ